MKSTPAVKHFSPPPEKKPSEHTLLCHRAEQFLKKQHCAVVIREPFKAATREQPDAIGWRDGVSILIECKATRSDFLADKYKPFRNDSGEGMGDWRFYLCPKGVIDKSELPPGWGLLYATAKTIQKIHGFPPNTLWHHKPFQGNKTAENIMLTSALRRLSIRGYLPEIYHGYPVRCQDCGELVR
ncbi:MAG: hypothetical protein C9356_15120 [Oleiphilus sp.]|nr:MAG: hypothetical protein C9356_15120 [Oleiphilus sp.]